MSTAQQRQWHGSKSAMASPVALGCFRFQVVLQSALVRKKYRASVRRNQVRFGTPGVDFAIISRRPRRIGELHKLGCLVHGVEVARIVWLVARVAQIAQLRRDVFFQTALIVSSKGFVKMLLGATSSKKISESSSQ